MKVQIKFKTKSRDLQVASATFVSNTVVLDENVGEFLVALNGHKDRTFEDKDIVEIIITPDKEGKG